MGKTTLSDIVGPEYTKLGFFREVQDKMAELETYNAELERKKQEIQDILNGIMDLLAVVSPDYRIVYVNRVFKNYFDIPHPEGLFCYQVFRGAPEPCPVCPLRNALQTGKPDKSAYIDHRPDRSLHFEVVASPMFDDKGQVRNVLVSKRDVTMEKEYQAKYYQSEKMATIGLLAAGVAHEINNPLAAISGFSEALKRRLPYLSTLLDKDTEKDLLEDFTDYTTTILEECNRCRDIVGNLLSFSSQKSCKFDTIDLNSLVAGTLKILHHQIKLHPGINLLQDLGPGPVTIQGAQGELKQVLLNLVLNAVDAIDSNGTITIRTSQDSSERVALIVEDTGQGIRSETLDKLFIPFFTTKTKGHSIGIGLSICYNIIKMHGGEIHVCSEPGKGSVFRVMLPTGFSATNKEQPT
jgi:two-component system, NtrC family, sensor kinase